MNLSVGDIFTRERTKKNLTIQDVEKGTRIRRRYIEAIEQTKWEEFESKVYITGLIKSYARFLGINEEKMIAYFRRDYEKQEDLQFKKKVEAKYFHPETRKLIVIAVAIIILVFFSYFSYQMIQFLSPPTVTIISPDVQVFRGKDRITIEAQTEPEAEVRIFDEQVFLDEEGRFSYDFPLQEGKNEFSIEVIGANGKTTIKDIQFILEE